MEMQLLVIVVERSHDMAVIDALEAAGVTAVTVLAGTGTGVWQQLDREVDAEKAIMLSVIQRDRVEAAFGALHAAGLTEPGRGVAFTSPVTAGIGFGLPGWDAIA